MMCTGKSQVRRRLSQGVPSSCQVSPRGLQVPLCSSQGPGDRGTALGLTRCTRALEPWRKDHVSRGLPLLLPPRRTQEDSGEEPFPGTRTLV